MDSGGGGGRGASSPQPEFTRRDAIARDLNSSHRSFNSLHVRPPQKAASARGNGQAPRPPTAGAPSRQWSATGVPSAPRLGVCGVEKSDTEVTSAQLLELRHDVEHIDEPASQVFVIGSGEVITDGKYFEIHFKKNFKVQGIAVLVGQQL